MSDRAEGDSDVRSEIVAGDLLTIDKIDRRGGAPRARSRWVAELQDGCRAAPVWVMIS